MATIIQLKRGKIASWQAWEASGTGNRLAIGEVGLLLNDDGSGEIIDRRTGDGAKAWANLPRDVVYWDQIATPANGTDELDAAQVQITSLVAALPQEKVYGLAASLALKSNLANPTFTGIPRADTAPTGTNGTQLATTAFVKAARIKPSWAALSGADSEILDKPNLTLKADLTSPTFSGIPTAPTAVTGTSNLQLATTAFVQAAKTKPDWNATIGAINEILNRPANATVYVAGLMSPADKTKLDSLGTGYLSVDWAAPTGSYNSIANKPDLSLNAQLISPAFTGVPTAPTAPTGTNGTQLATTAFVKSLLGTIDGGNATT